jgi:hypothetical protein
MVRIIQKESTVTLRRLTCLPLLGLACLLGACANTPRTEVTFPLNRAWVNGAQVEYVTTDISDATMAQAVGVNYVPRLAAAIPAAGRASLLERVYKFPKGEQISIFQSAPTPTGGTNQDLSYSPLWRLVFVTWVRADKVRELTSEEELLAAEERGDLSLKISNVVANCPITRGPDGQLVKSVH